ncbi:hypothetical protein VTL71DRAFT_7095 [Oculimacula yallundae]|uniref:Uncharacterized protein n=1 Tax=Oculimacula yallundae TaxID=86028 RepID=A0ABR4BVQ2_9HELO
MNSFKLVESMLEGCKQAVQIPSELRFHELCRSLPQGFKLVDPFPSRSPAGLRRNGMNVLQRGLWLKPVFDGENPQAGYKPTWPEDQSTP